MSNFGRLPPVLRVASYLRLLLFLAPTGPLFMLLIPNPRASPQSGAYASRVAVIAVNLAVVGLSSIAAVHTYEVRFRQPERRPFPLESWQSQVRAIVLPAAVSLCAMVLAVVISPTARAFEVVFPVSIIGAGVCFVFSLDALRAGSRGLP